MRIILSPAKTMSAHPERETTETPEFLDKTEEILKWMESQSPERLQKLWNTSIKLTEQSLEQLNSMNLRKNLTPAVFAYEGTAFQHLDPASLSEESLSYLQKHLRILSAFYGVLKPLDGITPYRLEMQAKANINGKGNLYEFWGKSLYESVREECGVIVNLASGEYSRCIESYLTDHDRYITVTFRQQSKGKISSYGPYCKMARGEMVRFMAENSIEDPEEIKKFDRLEYRFRVELSTGSEFVFVRE